MTPLVIDFCGSAITLRRERGEYLHCWRDVVDMAVRGNQYLVLKNFTL